MRYLSIIECTGCLECVTTNRQFLVIQSISLWVNALHAQLSTSKIYQSWRGPTDPPPPPLLFLDVQTCPDTRHYESALKTRNCPITRDGGDVKATFPLARPAALI